MTIGSWNPEIQTNSDQLEIDLPLLQRFISISSENRLDQLEASLSADERQQYAGLMRLDKDKWSIADTLDDEDIEHLMRFFTVAEKLPGWEGEAQSPVIWLGKILKQRGTGINKELLQWIKSNSDNRFLPHGPLL